MCGKRGGSVRWECVERVRRMWRVFGGNMRGSVRECEESVEGV